MNHDDIVRMARESGWPASLISPVVMAKLAEFALLVTAAEREACAKVCEEFEFEFADDSAGTLIDVAKAIRARREK